jgi:hypothetical protein
MTTTALYEVAAGKVSASPAGARPLNSGSPIVVPAKEAP